MGGDGIGPHERSQQHGQRAHTRRGVGFEVTQLKPEQPQCPQGNGRVHEAKQQPRAHQPQLGHQQQGKGHGHRQRAQVIEREHLRHQVFERHVALQDAHDQRNFQPNQHAHQQHQCVQHETERPRHVAMGQEQQGRQQATGQRHQQLNAQKMRRQLSLEEPRQVGPDAHGKQVGPDDGGKLQHRVAQHVAGQRTGRQLVQQAAGGNDKHAGQQRHFQGGRLPGGRHHHRRRLCRARCRGTQRLARAWLKARQ